MGHEHEAAGGIDGEESWGLALGRLELDRA
jgi:hypothetical protein